MNAGDLKNKIQILKTTVVTDTDGFQKQETIVFANCWAKVTPVQGKEYYQAAAIQAENDVKFTIRYRKGITNDMKVQYNNQIYEIKSIIDFNNEHKYIDLVCEVITNG